MYEVYDKNTEKPICYKRDGKPLRFSDKLQCEIIIYSAREKYDYLHISVIDTYNIPFGADLQVREVHP